MPHRVRSWLCFTLALALSSACKTIGGDDDDPTQQLEEVARSCTVNCLKPACTGNITVDPEFELSCEARCEDRVAQAEAQGCLRVYEELLSCLEAAVCADYYLWLEQSAGAPCVALEAELESSCADIVVREPEWL